jgi:hypothetical protein
MEIYIPGNVPSSKNSKQWTGKYLINSKTTTNYIKDTRFHYKQFKAVFEDMVKGLEKPYHISFYFIRSTRRKFDYINPAQTVQDLMVKNFWVEDDNMENIIPYFDGYEVDKEKAGVIIRVVEENKRL